MVIKSKLLLEREKIENFSTVQQVQGHKSMVNPEKWNKLAYAEIMRLCDEQLKKIRTKQ